MLIHTPYGHRCAVAHKGLTTATMTTLRRFGPSSLGQARQACEQRPVLAGSYESFKRTSMRFAISVQARRHQRDPSGLTELVIQARQKGRA